MGLGRLKSMSTGHEQVTKEVFMMMRIVLPCCNHDAKKLSSELMKNGNPAGLSTEMILA